MDPGEVQNELLPVVDAVMAGDAVAAVIGRFFLDLGFRRGVANPAPERGARLPRFAAGGEKDPSDTSPPPFLRLTRLEPLLAARFVE